jgi:hypothetical protein
MKTRALVQAISIVLLTGQFTVGFAQYGQQGGYGQNLQGTCEGEDCNQQWQPRNEQGSQQHRLDNGELIQTEAINVTDNPLTEEARESLLFMREEEKLARDVYTVLYEKWGTPIFANIAVSEQRHIDSVLWLMQQYGLEDTATDTTGVFTNTELQDLYNTLIARGETSQLEALQVGALIEEVDIADLEAALITIDNPAIQQVYANLIAGSEKHLQGFVRNIENLGYTYTAQSLDANRVSEILSGSANSAGFAINPDAAQMQSTSAQFRPNVSTDKGQYGNQLQVNATESLNVGMTIIPDSQHRGQSADIVNVVSYTADGADSAQMFMRNAENGWQTWDGNLNNLVAAQTQQQLGQQNRVTVFDGQLGAKGRFQISVGYRLQDGTLIFNGEPIEFTISE